MRKNLLFIISIASVFLASCNSDDTSNSVKPSATHTVTFKNGDEVLETKTVPHGESVSFSGEIPQKESDNQEFSFDFIGWDKSHEIIQGDLVLNATYQAIKNQEIEVGDYIYRPIYNETLSSLIGYEIRYYNNMDYEGNLVAPSTYNNLPILRIGEGCFMDCKIKTLSLPNTIKVIDAYAFNSCENIQELSFPDSCKVLYNAAIFYDNNLTSINLNNLEFIGIDNFHICPKLKTLSVSAHNVSFSVENNILYSKDFATLIKAPENLENIVINNSTKELKSESLSRLNAAKEITIPASITTLPEKTFFEAKVEKVELQGDIKTIESQTFSHCTKLRQIVLPNSLKEIKERAFYHCESLIEVNFPESLESIGEFSFAYCYKLEEFYIPSALFNIGYGALDEQDSLKEFVVNENNKYFKAYDNCLYSDDFTSLLRVPQTKDSIDFNEKINVIGSGAFYKCQNFTALELPNTIELIQDYAFYFMNKIYHLSIPDSVKYIEEGAFQNMEVLIDIHLPSGLNSISKGLLENCPLLQEVNIPYGVTIIGDNAFSNCINLPMLVISKNLESFGKDTFAACNMLDTIKYEGSSSDWSKIKNRDISGLTSETEIIYNFEIM